MQNHKLSILWDMDGTIIDSKECHFRSWEIALNKHGFKLDRSLYEKNFGRNNQTALPVYLGFQPDQILAEGILEEKEVIFRNTVGGQSQLIAGVRDWLEDASMRDYPQLIASSAPMENIVSVLETFNLTGFFDHLISGTDLPAKPEPDVFLKACAIVAYPPENCLVIEDSLHGVMAAKNAGMRCIAVATSGRQANLDAAELVIDDFTFPFEDALTRIF